MRHLILLALLLTPSICHAGMAAKRMMAVMQVSCNPAHAINCVSAISSSGTADTGTDSLTTGEGGGDISIHAVCSGGSGSSHVYLAVGEVEPFTVRQIDCGSGTTDDTTLTYTVDGAYTVRVYGTKSGTGTFSADTFVLPVSP